MKPLLLIILLTSLNCFAQGNSDHNDDGHPGYSDPPNDNCSHCDEPEPEEEAPIPQGIYWFAAGVLFMKLYNAKKKCDDSRENI